MFQLYNGRSWSEICHYFNWVVLCRIFVNILTRLSWSKFVIIIPRRSEIQQLSATALIWNFQHNYYIDKWIIINRKYYFLKLSSSSAYTIKILKQMVKGTSVTQCKLSFKALKMHNIQSRTEDGSLLPINIQNLWAFGISPNFDESQHVC